MDFKAEFDKQVAKNHGNVKKEFSEDEEMKEFANWLNYRNMELTELLNKLNEREPPNAPGKFHTVRDTLEGVSSTLTKAVDYYYRRADGLDY